MSGNIDRIDNVIEVSGPLDDFHRFLSQIHTAIEKKGYQEVTLDLSQCTSAFQNSMLSLCAQILAYRKAGIDFSLIPPMKNGYRIYFKILVGHTIWIPDNSTPLHCFNNFSTRSAS